LQKFRILGGSCAVAASPTRSPTTSPVIRIRRKRKTLRMLFTGVKLSPDQREISGEDERISGRKLKDLFVSSPTALDGCIPEEDMKQSLLTAARRDTVRSLRPLSAALRRRLLRRPWRPVLVGIPE
ncbi:hypothetical protein M569_13916, partial [Genlisea aurea]